MTSIVDRPATASGERAAPDARRRTSPPRRVARAAAAVARRTTAIAAFLAVWELAPRLGFVNRTFLVPFSATLPALWRLAADGQLWSNT